VVLIRRPVADVVQVDPQQTGLLSGPANISGNRVKISMYMVGRRLLLK
jgi:hypothetical protein